MAWGDMTQPDQSGVGMTGAAESNGAWSGGGAPAMNPTTTARVGVAGQSKMSIPNVGTFGHDTHPLYKDPPPDEDPSRSFFHDRRNEGRRHAPTCGCSH